MKRLNLKIYTTSAAEFLVKAFKTAFPEFMKQQKNTIVDGAYIHDTGRFRTIYDWFEFADDGEISFVIHMGLSTMSDFEARMELYAQTSDKLNVARYAVAKFLEVCKKQFKCGGLQKSKLKEFKQKAKWLDDWWHKGIIEKDAEEFIGHPLNPFQQEQFKTLAKMMMSKRANFNYAMLDNSDEIALAAKEIYLERLNDVFDYLKECK